MKVVFKFAFAFFAASLLCLAISTFVLANSEATRLERALGAGLMVYGDGIRNAVETEWNDKDFEAAERLVRGFEQGDVRARLTRTDEFVDELAREAVVLAHDPNADVMRIRMRVAGRDGKAVLVLERRVLDREAILRDELADQLLAAAALAAAMAALAAVLGAVVIGRPLGRIVQQARRIGEGDFSQRLRSTGNDEIGTLKRELNGMCDRLALANARLDEETTARIETLEKLRHLDRLRTVGTIASGIAHELGTPLNVLLLRGQSLAKDPIEEHDVRDAGRAVLGQVDKMSRIVRQLLDFSRLRGTPKNSSSEVDLGAVAQHAASLLASLAKKHGVTIAVDADDAPRSKGDFRQIEQALTNLIVNGIQAMPKGGQITVRVRADKEGTDALVEVVDEGEGMSDDVIARVFEPFFTTKPTSDGTGLGLHVARGIAEDHGGSIGVVSTPGTGSTFTLRIPRCS